MGNKIKILISLLIGFMAGFTIGGYLLSDTQPRSFLAISKCNNCWDLNEVAGLLLSVGIAKTPGFIPNVAKETQYNIAIRHPFPRARIHFVILPKKDIKDISDITEQDQPYISDAIRLIGELAREYKLKNYRLSTNGQGHQSARYLHFHLVSE